MNNIDPKLQQDLAALVASGQAKVLWRMVPEELALPPDTDITDPRFTIGLVLDTETTGRSPQTDKLVELGMVAFAFDKETGDILGVVDTFNQLEDPGIPMPAEASAINHITDEMLKGQHIDDDRVQGFIRGAEIIIAHNAGFDRKFCENRFDSFSQIPWACSNHQVDWPSLGITGKKLEYLATVFGFFYEGHRAEIDCFALLKVLMQKPPELQGKTVFSLLLENSKQEGRKVWAVAAPFDAKKELQDRGYTWHPGTDPDTEKAWAKEVPLAEFDDELKWLKSAVYQNRKASVVVDRVDATSRFSARRNKLPAVVL